MEEGKKKRKRIDYDGDYDYDYDYDGDGDGGKEEGRGCPCWPASGARAGPVNQACLVAAKPLDFFSLNTYVNSY